MRGKSSGGVGRRRGKKIRMLVSYLTEVPFLICRAVKFWMSMVCLPLYTVIYSLFTCSILGMVLVSRKPYRPLKQVTKFMEIRVLRN